MTRQPYLVSGEGPGGLLLVAPRVVRTWTYPPETLEVPVLVTVTKGGGEVDLESVTVDLGSFSAEALCAENLAEGASIAGRLVAGVTPPVRLRPQDGDVIPVTLTAMGRAGSDEVAATAELVYGVTSLPVRTGWYAGDGHIHTAWSPDVVLVSIDGRASSAVTHGLKWIVITDHADGIGSNWPSYVSQCNAAQTNRGIPVMPGFECTAVESDSGCDALGYYCKEWAASIPPNQTLTPQGLIDAIRDHNPPYSYSVIAHPYGSPDWDTWTATGYSCMELISNEGVAKSTTISKWFSLLRSGLASTISTGKFVVGLGNSDCHNNCGPGDTGSTWLYCPSYSPTNRSGVWNAIKAGKASASGLGDLGCFSLNGYSQGSVVNVSPGSTLEFRLIQQPLSTSVCTQMTIYRQDQTVLKSYTNPPTTETVFQTTAGSTDTFYVVEFLFFDSVSLLYYDVWANPIFVNVP